MSEGRKEIRALRRHLRDLLRHREALARAIALLEASQRERINPVHRARRVDLAGTPHNDGAAH